MSGLGSFWPEPLAGIIAADQAARTRSRVRGSADLRSAGLPQPGGQPGHGERGPGPSGPAAEPLPPGATPGLTGHAPMVADGYYAAATVRLGRQTRPRPRQPGGPRPRPSRRSTGSLSTRQPDSSTLRPRERRRSTGSPRSSRPGRRAPGRPAAGNALVAAGRTPPCRPPPPHPNTRLRTGRRPGRSSSRPPAAPGPGPASPAAPAAPAVSQRGNPAGPVRTGSGGGPPRPRFRPPCSARSG